MFIEKIGHREVRLVNWNPKGTYEHVVHIDGSSFRNLGKVSFVVVIMIVGLKGCRVPLESRTT